VRNYRCAMSDVSGADVRSNFQILAGWSPNVTAINDKNFDY